MNPCLLIVDMQKYFYDLNPETFDTKLIPAVRNVLEVARKSAIPVIYLITMYKNDKSDWPQAWTHRESIWCTEDTDGATLVNGIDPLENEKIMVKTRYSGFYNSDLDDVLRSKKIDSLFLAGYACDVCVRFTAMDAYNRGYNIYLLADCVHSYFEDTESSISYLKKLTNLTVSSVDNMKLLVKVSGGDL